MGLKSLRSTHWFKSNGHFSLTEYTFYSVKIKRLYLLNPWSNLSDFKHFVIGWPRTTRPRVEDKDTSFVSSMTSLTGYPLKIHILDDVINKLPIIKDMGVSFVSSNPPPSIPVCLSVGGCHCKAPKQVHPARHAMHATPCTAPCTAHLACQPHTLLTPPNL